MSLALSVYIPVLRPVTDFLNIKSLDETDLAVKPIVSPLVSSVK